MADYQKMYALLCGAVDDVIDPLEQIPLGYPLCKRSSPRAGGCGGAIHRNCGPGGISRKFSCGGLWMIRFCDRIQGIPVFLRRSLWDLPLFYCLPVWP